MPSELGWLGGPHGEFGHLVVLFLCFWGGGDLGWGSREERESFRGRRGHVEQLRVQLLLLHLLQLSQQVVFVHVVLNFAFNPLVAVLPLWGLIVRVLDEVETNGESSKFGAKILHKLQSLQNFKLGTVIRNERNYKARLWLFKHFSISASNTVKNKTGILDIFVA